jgi:hypothetical protein
MKSLLVLTCSLVGVLVMGQDGPLSVRNHRAQALVFLRFEPGQVKLKPGQRVWSFSSSIANEFKAFPRFRRTVVLLEDYELHRLGVTFRQGMKGGSFWEIEVPFMSRNGGILDGVIGWWHQFAFGFSTGRDTSPRGRAFLADPKNGPFGSATGFGDVSVKAGFPLSDRQSLRIGAKLPTGDERKLLGSGAPDFGIEWQGETRSDRWGLHGQFALVWQGESPNLRSTRKFVDQEMIGLSYRKNSETWLAQWQSEASGLRTGVAASDATHRMLVLGYRRVYSDRILELAMLEDGDFPFNYSQPELVNAAADFTLSARLTIRF